MILLVSLDQLPSNFSIRFCVAVRCDVTML